MLDYVMPVSSGIHVAGGSYGRLLLRDKNLFEEEDIFISTRSDIVYVDEALLFSGIGAFRLLANTASSAQVGNPCTVVVSPNGTTVTDATQFLTCFTLMNALGRCLDKGGTEDKHIIFVNQFFIDGTKPDGDNGANPLTAFNSLTQPAFLTVLNTAYTTVWVSGPVKTTGTHNLPIISRNNVNLRRYTDFAVAAQPFAAYDSVMITIEPGTSP